MGGGVKFDLERKKMCKAAIAGSQEHKDKEAKLVETFEKWDLDKNGYITKDELTEVLKALGLPTGEGGDEVEKMIKEADLDEDGKINYQEMVHWLCRAPFLEDYFLTSVDIFKRTHTKLMKDMGQVMKETQEAKAKLTASKSEDDCGIDPGELALGLDMMKKMSMMTMDVTKTLRQRIDEELTPVIKRSFAHHDKDGSGKLSTDESIIFFSNFMALWEPFHQTMSEMGSLMEANAPNDGMEEEELPEAYESLAQKITLLTPEKLHQAYKSKYAVLEKDRMENIDEKMKKAFEVLAMDGQISEEAVVEGLLHGMPKNKKFLDALGLLAADCMAVADASAPSLGGDEMDLMAAEMDGMFVALEDADCTPM